MYHIRNWDKFGTEMVNRYGTWLTKKCAPRTFYFEMQMLISVCKWLIAQKFLAGKYRIHLRLAKPEGTDTYCYTQNQVQRMLEFCQQSPAGRWIHPVLIALATTGMCIGELISLRWEDIDFVAESIKVVDNRFSHKQRQMGTTRTTKGKRSRCIPLPPALKQVLSEMQRAPDGFVFHGAKGARLRDRRVLEIFRRKPREPLKKEFLIPQGGIGFSDGTIHSFRHDFVSECFRQGATEAEVMDWVGHRESQMVQHYRHLRPDDSRLRMQSLNFLGDYAG